MSQITLTVSDEELGAARQMASQRGFDSPEAYVHSLLAKELVRADDAALGELLKERLRQPTVEMTPEAFERLHERIASELTLRRKP